MKTSGDSSRIDFGKLAAVTVFSFPMILTFLGLSSEIRTLFPMDTDKVLTLVHHLVVTAFYVLIISLYFLRISASATTNSFPAKFIALFATFLPLIMPFLSNSAWTGPIILIISNMVMLGGMVFTLAALVTLGKSFSIFPQTRKLVVGGPYRLIRHPVYLGEITCTLGLTLAGISIHKILVFLLIAGCQIYRSIQEEKLLNASFPEYAEYASKTARFIPGFF
jgi:protein-S-isoprenylcysteine O-methyltransferase Ste14